jgi:hypothetical protein
VAGAVLRLEVELDMVRASGQCDKASSNPGHSENDRVGANLGSKETGI